MSNEKAKDTKPKIRRGGIGSINGPVGTVIVGGSGTVHTGTGDVYVDGKKQPKAGK